MGIRDDFHETRGRILTPLSRRGMVGHSLLLWTRMWFWVRLKSVVKSHHLRLDIVVPPQPLSRPRDVIDVTPWFWYSVGVHWTGENYLWQGRCLRGRRTNKTEKVTRGRRDRGTSEWRVERIWAREKDRRRTQTSEESKRVYPTCTVDKRDRVEVTSPSFHPTGNQKIWKTEDQQIRGRSWSYTKPRMTRIFL